MNCLILTGGFRPSGAILGRASEKGVPVVAIQADTIPTVERVESMIHDGRVRDREAVEQVQELLHAHAVVDALLG